MLIGYSIIDPLVVLGFTSLAAYFLVTRPVRLVPYLPAALSMWFFIPGVTLLTPWQTVSLLLIGRIVLLGRVRLPQTVAPVFLLAVMFISLAFLIAMLDGNDRIRAIIRLIYYAGILALLLFTYEMGRQPEGYRLFVKGLVITGIIFAAYGAYQVLASATGMPYRGIIRSLNFTQAAFEGGQIRINSFASEPKRLGFVLFVCGLACFYYRDFCPHFGRRLALAGAFVLAMSVLTFAGSYFFAIALFAPVALVIYPSLATRYILGFWGLAVIFFSIFPDSFFIETIVDGYERRMNEVEVGLDGTKVYRQEFYAQDYLERHPATGILGVGLGQYYSRLHSEYGLGAGLSTSGGLIPLNSNLFEMVFDLGGVATVLFYSSVVFVIYRLRRSQEPLLALALLFLIMQSFTILTMLYLVMFLGISLGRLARHRRQSAKWGIARLPQQAF